MRKEKQKGVCLESIPEKIEANYADKDIVLINDIRRIPKELLAREPLNPNFYIFVICLKGELQIEVKSETMILLPNDILCNNSNTILKSCMISPDLEARILCLSPQMVSRLLHSGKNIWYNNFYTNQNPVLHIGEDGRKLFMLYYDLLEHKLNQDKHPYYRESLTGLISAALYDLHAFLSRQYSSLNTNALLTQGDLLFKRFIDLLSKEEVKKRKVLYYADKLCISPKYLSTTVKEISGKTALDWINEYVVADIQYHLKHSELTIKEIAELLDFENLSFFGKYLKKHLGLSPTDYRRDFGKSIQ